MRFFLLMLCILMLPVFAANDTEECPGCAEFRGKPQASLLLSLAEGTNDVGVYMYYENTSAFPARQPIQNSIILVELSNVTGWRVLFKVYGDENGTAKFSFKNWNTSCMDIKVVYCPFCKPGVEACGLEQCLNYGKIPNDLANFSNYGTQSGNITSIDNISTEGSTRTVSNDSYLPDMAVLNWCPPEEEGMSTPALCFYGTIIFALLGGALYLTGRNPFAGFNIGAQHIGRHIRYQARGRSVSISTTAIASAAASIAGTAKGAKKSADKKSASKRQELKAAKDRGASKQEIKQLKHEIRQLRHEGRMEFHRESFRSTGLSNSPFSSIRRVTGMVSSLRKARATVGPRKPGEKMSVRARAIGAAFSKNFQTLGLSTGSGIQMTAGAGGRMTPTSGGATGGSGVSASGGFGKMFARTMLAIAIDLVMRSNLGVVLSAAYAVFPSTFITQTASLTELLERITAGKEREKAAEESKRLESIRTDDGKGVRTAITSPDVTLPSLALGGETVPGKVGERAEVRSTGVIDPNTGKASITVTFQPGDGAPSLGKIGKMEVTSATLRDGGNGNVTVSMDVRIPGTGQTFTTFTISAPATVDDKGKVVGIGAPQLSTEGKPMDALPNGSTLDRRDIRDFNNFTQALETTHNNVRGDLAQIAEARSAALSNARVKTDADLNHELNKSPELQVRAENNRISYAEGACAVAGINVPETVGTSFSASATAMHVSDAMAESGFGAMPKAVSMAGELTRDLALNREAGQSRENFQRDNAALQNAVQTLVLNHSLNDLAGAGTDPAHVRSDIAASLVANGMNPAEASKLVDRIGDSGLSRMVTHVATEANGMLKDFSKQGFQETYIRTELGTVAVGALGEVAAAGVAIKQSYDNPAAAFSLPTSQADDLRVSGRAGELLRERELLMLAESQASMATTQAFATENFFNVNAKAAKALDDYTHACAANALLTAGLRKEMDHDPAVAATGDALQALTVNTAIAAQCERVSTQTPFMDPAAAAKIAVEEQDARAKIETEIKSGDYAGAAGAASQRAEYYRGQGNYVAAASYDKLGTDLSFISQAPEEYQRVMQNNVVDQISALPSAERIAQTGSLQKHTFGVQERLSEALSYEDPQKANLQAAHGVLADEYRFRLAAGDKEGATICLRGLEDLNDIMREFEKNPPQPNTADWQNYRQDIEGLSESIGGIIDPSLSERVMQTAADANTNAASAYQAVIKNATKYIQKKLADKGWTDRVEPDKPKASGGG